TPAYIEQLTSKETNEEMEGHMDQCDACQNYLDEMKGDLVLEREDDKRRDKRNVDYLKKVRSKNRKKIIIVATSLLSIFLILITTYYFVFENMWLVKSDNVETIIQKRDTLVT